MLKLWELWLTFSTAILDRVLGWTLSWPRDLTLLMVSIFTAAILLAVRLVLVNRQLMQIIKQDQKKLKEHLSQARQSADHDALQRHFLNRGRVAVRKLLAEFPAVVLGMVIFSTITYWGSMKLNTLPLQVGTQFDITLELPANSDGTIAHIVPESGLTAETGWVKRVQRQPGESKSQASWRLTAEQGTYELMFRVRNETLQHQLIVDGRTPTRERVTHQPLGNTRLWVPQYRPAGIFGNVGSIPAWLVGYLILLSLFYLGSKWALRIP